MGMFDELEIAEGVELPEYPADPTDPLWQTKTLGSPVMQTYKISSDGRLLRKEQEYRDKTWKELKETAERHGYDTYAEMEEDDDFFGPFETWKETVDEEWWVDHNQHGSFEFHHVYTEGKTERNSDEGPPYEYDVKDYYSYEARFTKGDLDEIVLLKVEDCT